MTTKNFPEDLLGRSILRQGFSYSRNQSVERTPMDSGLPRGRLYNKNPTAKVPVVYQWDEDQVVVFEAWLQNIANRGASWFNVYLPLEGGSYRQVLARVADVPARASAGALLMNCPIEFEIHDALIAPDGFIELVALVGGRGAQDIAAVLDGITLAPAFEAWEFPADA
ncbi:MAG: hypothetical protein GC182_03195 [Rhodopseudomonas sp.]|nr:hypothetical protein [Rhodopseudomonas sp.]